MFIFLVPSCIRNEIHAKQLERCINSIRYFHRENTIYIINDSDDEKDIIYTNVSEKYNNIIIIKSEYRGAGETNCFKFILENEKEVSEKNYFIMHDSMLLNEKLINIDCINNIQFLWHFTNHIIDWDNIVEEKTDYNIINNIKSHTDLLRHHIIRDYSCNAKFKNFALDLLENKNKWCGCMGFCCITNKKTIKYMNNIVPFIDNFLQSTNRNRRNRIVNESLFSIICHFIYQDINFKDSYDGLYYDGIQINSYATKPCGFDNLQYLGRNKYISKISFSR
jgi:hypothetical protein